MPRGGRRPGAGAPRHNINRLSSGRYSALGPPASETLALIREFAPTLGVRHPLVFHFFRLLWHLGVRPGHPNPFAGDPGRPVRLLMPLLASRPLLVRTSIALRCPDFPPKLQLPAATAVQDDPSARLIESSSSGSINASPDSARAPAPPALNLPADTRTNTPSNNQTRTRSRRRRLRPADGTRRRYRKVR